MAVDWAEFEPVDAAPVSPDAKTDWNDFEPVQPVIKSPAPPHEPVAGEWTAADEARFEASHPLQPTRIGGTSVDIGQGPVPVLRPPAEAGTAEKVASGVWNTLAGIPNFIATPSGVATVALPEIAAGTRVAAPLGKAMKLGFTALMTKAAAEQAGKASVTRDPQDITEAVGAAALTGAGAAFGDRLLPGNEPARVVPKPFTTPEAQEALAARSRSILPDAEAALREVPPVEQPTTPEVSDASSLETPTEIHGSLRSLPVEGAREVPTQEGGERILAPEVQQQGQVPLTEKYPEVYADAPKGQMPVEIQKADGTVVPAVVNGFYDLSSLPGRGIEPSIGVKTAGGWSHGMLAKGDKIITPDATPESFEKFKAESAKPADLATAPPKELGKPTARAKKVESSLAQPDSPLTHVEGEIGKIRLKGAASPENQQHYGESYNKLRKARPDLFSPNGSEIDIVESSLASAGKNVTRDTLFDTLLGNHLERTDTTQGRTPEAKADNFYEAVQKNKAKPSSEPIPVGQMTVGQKFKLAGEDFEVTHIDPDTFEVTVKDGRKFGAQTIPDGETIHADKGTAPKLDPGVKKPGMVGMGGAIPGEFEGQQSTVSNMFAVIDQSRREMGLPPMPDTKRRTWDEDNQRALARMNKDPNWIPDLVKEVTANPRPLLSWENAGVVWQRAKYRSEFDNALSRVAKSYEDGREDDLVEARLDAARYEDLIQELDTAVGRSGTGSEAGRSLQAQKMGAGDDFSLIEMRLRKRVSANDGAPLSPAQEAEIQKLHDDIQASQKVLDQHLAEEAEARSEMEANRIADEAIKEAAKAPRIHPAILAKAESIVAGFERRADAARARLRERLGRTSAGVDPLILKDLAEIGLGYLSRGALDFAKWSASMVGELGDMANPYLADAFKESQRLLEEGLKDQAPAVRNTVKRSQDVNEQIMATGEAIEKKVTAGKKNEIAGQVQKLARLFVKRGVKDREDLISKVHDVLQRVMPDITRRETMDAISGYGDYKQLTKDQISVQLRDLKGQMQQVGKLEDIQARQPPLKSGVERRAPSDEERRLIAQVNEAKRRFGIAITDPATQLKSALDARKTFYRNQITDLEAQIAKREKFIKTKSPSPTDPELEGLKTKRDALKADFGKILEEDPTHNAEMRANALEQQKSALEKRITEQERKLREGDLKGAARPVNRPADPLLEGLKQRRDELNRQIAEARRGPKLSQEEISLKALKTRLQNSIEELQDRLAKKDFSPRAKPKAVALDPEAMRLKAENERLKQKFRLGIAKDKLKARNWWQKTMDTVVKWRRGFILSGPVTLAKLTAAAVARGVITPLEEGVGAGISKLIPSVAAKARREGGASLTAESKAISEGFTRGMQDAWKTLRTGQSDLDVVFGKGEHLPQSFIDIFGNIHGALKAPVKRAEFARSFQKRVEAYAREGVDVTDEFVQTKIGLEAYQDSMRSIFMQKNMLNDAYKRLLSRFDQLDKETGKPTLAGAAAGTTARVLLPIVKVPTNIVAETMQYAVGSVTGSARLGLAFKRGIENLKPEEADLILRHLKKGSLGAAAMLAGYLAPQVFGGFYQQGQKRSKQDIPPDAARVNGVDIPPAMIHNPFLTAAQVGATARRVSDSKLRKRDSQTQGLSHGAVAAALGLADATPFVREMTEIEKAMNPYQRDQWTAEMAKSMLVPQALQSLANQLDKNAKGETVKRKAVGPLEGVESGIPGLRQTLPEKR